MFSIIFATFGVGQPVFAKDEVAKYGQVLIGDDGNSTAEVEMAQVGPVDQNMFLIKVTGVNHPLDGKVTKCKKVPAGADAWYFEKPEGGNLLREQKTYGYTGYELYLGGETHKMRMDAKKSKAFKRSDRHGLEKRETTPHAPFKPSTGNRSDGSNPGLSSHAFQV